MIIISIIRRIRDSVSKCICLRKLARIEHLVDASAFVEFDPDLLPRVWAHAGGGRYHIYGNSREAYDDAIKSGFMVLEADVALTSDGVPVMTHAFRPNNEVMFDNAPTLPDFLAAPLNDRYTPLTLEDFIKRYGARDVFFALDPDSKLRGFAKFDLPAFLVRCGGNEFCKKVIYQISGVDDLEKFAKGHPFAALHYNINADLLDCGNRDILKRVLAVLKKMKVPSVSFADRPLTDSIIDALRICSNEGFVVSMGGVNSQRRYDDLKQYGLSCIDTDYLYPEGRIR